MPDGNPELVAGLGLLVILAISGVADMMIRWRKSPAARLVELKEEAAFVASELRHLKVVMHAFGCVGLKDVRALAREHRDVQSFLAAYRLKRRWVFGSPFVRWLETWVIISESATPRSPGDWWRGNRSHQGWDQEASLRYALNIHHQRWEREHDRLMVRASKLQDKIDALSKELGVESQNYLEPEAPRIRSEAPVESKRDKLARLREEADKLEDEILAEEQEAASGPHRRASGVSGRD